MGIGTLVAMLVTTLVVIGVLATQETYSLFLPGLLQGAWLTIQITILGALLAVVMGVLAALARLYGPAPLGGWRPSMSNLPRHLGPGAAILAVRAAAVRHPDRRLQRRRWRRLNVGAYGSEVVRGAIGSVARGQ